MNTNLEKYYLVYGGLNTNPNPFPIGSVLRQKNTVTSVAKDAKIIDGKEEYEFIGMKGDMMQLKSLNKAAAWSIDTVNETVINLSKSKGFSPEIGSITILHYMYADRFKVIK